MNRSLPIHRPPPESDSTTAVLRADCRHFVGARPCRYNKLDGSECQSCDWWAPATEAVLFIKLDALGDVVRSAALIPALLAHHRGARVTWLTRPEAVELVKAVPGVDEVLALGADCLPVLAARTWDHVYSLSNEVVSASLATLVQARKSFCGFRMNDGVLQPSNQAAHTWMALGCFDRLKRETTHTYQRRMLDIMGLTDRSPQAPTLTLEPALVARCELRLQRLTGARRSLPLVGINVGAGERWPKKMLAASSIEAVVEVLLSEPDRCNVLLIGGRAEMPKIEAIVEASRHRPGLYPAATPDSLLEFAALISRLDVAITGDTLALHLATAWAIPTVAVFGPTGWRELDDPAGVVTKVTSSLPCLECYGDCDRPRDCMGALDPARLARLALRKLAREARPDDGANRPQVEESP
jgi:ADP-heptose:LPS heptosyltransferase